VSTALSDVHKYPFQSRLAVCIVGLPRAILTAPSSELSLISDYVEGREQMLMSKVWFMFKLDEKTQTSI